jgi:hypothetical protein
MSPAAKSLRPRALILVSVLGIVVSIGATHAYRLQTRLDAIERAPVARPHDLELLREDLSRIEGRISESLVELEAIRSDSGRRVETLDGRLARVETDLVEAAASLNEHQAQIEEWEVFRELAGPRALDERMESFAKDVAAHWAEVGEVAQTAIDLAEATSTNLDLVRGHLARDTDRMWRELVGPTVQLTGDSTVGSGVLLESQLVEEPDVYRTYLVTAWHVVRDIQDGEENRAMPIPVTVYGQDGRVWHETAELLRFNAGLDAALLSMNTTRRLECGARLAPPERISKARIFEQVYAVGCPLGNDPIPTFGEIADVRHVVDGESYWMISAPTYIGNSGGGIFDAENHELLGVFSKIYTHGALRPTVVPHMGLVTPLDAVYGWLETVGFAHVIPPRKTGDEVVDTQVASAKR